MQLFYCENIEGTMAILSAEESRHCKVLRKSNGDKIEVIDGKGTLYQCTIVSMDSKGVELQIRSKQLMPTKKYRMHLYIAPTKQNERIEWMLEKAVEAGLDEISFIETEHSEKSRIKTDRLHKIAISAIKQSGYYYLPIIHPLVKLKEIETKGMVYVAHCYADETKQSLIQRLTMDKPSDISIFIGPEGDFSTQELDFLKGMQAKAVSLGNSRLRTETAGLYCCMVLNAMHAF